MKNKALKLSCLFYKDKLIILGRNDGDLEVGECSSGQTADDVGCDSDYDSSPLDPYGMSSEAKYSDCDIWGFLNSIVPFTRWSRSLPAGIDGYALCPFQLKIDDAYKVSLMKRGGYCWLIIEKGEEELAQALSN
nr:hypothetical protein [uncultured Porphyromonas sp.]